MSLVAVGGLCSTQGHRIQPQQGDRKLWQARVACLTRGKLLACRLPLAALWATPLRFLSEDGMHASGIIESVLS